MKSVSKGEYPKAAVLLKINYINIIKTLIMSNRHLDLEKTAINYLQSMDEIEPKCKNRTRVQDFHSPLFTFSIAPNIAARREKGQFVL